MTDFQKYEKLNIDGSWINLEGGPKKGGCFCTPKGAEVIGWENGIHYPLPHHHLFICAFYP